MTWTVQRSRRSSGGRKRWYAQAVWLVAGKRHHVTSLGYLDEHWNPDELWPVWKARAKAAPSPDKIAVTTSDEETEDRLTTDPERVKDAIRYWVVDNDEWVRDHFARQQAEASDEKIASGDYGALPLRDYYQRVWKPIRSRANPGSFQREEGRWNAIVEALGHVPVRDLTAMRWHLFLEGQTTWGPASKRIAQNAYRVMLKHAANLGVIDGVHGFNPVKNGHKRQREPQPLTESEVEALLKAARPRDRAMWATAIGQCLRPTESYRVRWEDIHWDARTMDIRGSKNKLAAAIVPMMPLTLRDPRTWWEAEEEPRTCGPFGPGHRAQRGDGPVGRASRRLWNCKTTSVTVACPNTAVVRAACEREHQAASYTNQS